MSAFPPKSVGEMVDWSSVSAFATRGYFQWRRNLTRPAAATKKAQNPGSAARVFLFRLKRLHELQENSEPFIDPEVVGVFLVCAFQ